MKNIWKNWGDIWPGLGVCVFVFILIFGNTDKIECILWIIVFMQIADSHEQKKMLINLEDKIDSLSEALHN